MFAEEEKRNNFLPFWNKNSIYIIFKFVNKKINEKEEEEEEGFLFKIYKYKSKEKEEEDWILYLPII